MIRRRSSLLSLAFTAILVACGGASSNDDDTASGGADFTLAGHGVGACETWHQLRSQLLLVSAQPCGDVGPVATGVARELAILWNTEPSSICGYFSGANGCGPLAPNNAFYCRNDDSISYHMPFMDQMSAQRGDFVPVVILAHEWGHLNQARAGLFNPTRATIQNELHADCQAGIFTAVEELQGHLEVGDAQAAFQAFCDFGDPATPWFNPDPHGNCADRTSSFVRGYNAGKAFADSICSPNGFATMLQACAN
jgi:hypothetical protein